MNNDLPWLAGLLPRLKRELRSPVFAVIVYNVDQELAAIILLQKAVHGARDRFGFVACRNDDRDARPIFQRLRLSLVLTQLPKISSRQEKIKPDRQRNCRDESRSQWHALFCNSQRGERYARSSARMGRRRMGLPVAAKMALHTAGAIGGVPGSPMPPGGSLLGTM
jgi:hypothetical protein